MEVTPLRPSHFHRFSLVFAILISWLASSCAACEEEFKCGSYVFGYPFGGRNSGCGDPALQLDCDHEEQKPLLNISGRQYYIVWPYTYFMPSKKLDRGSSHNMKLIDKNLQGDKCSPSRSDNTAAQFWSSPQFHLKGEYENLTLLEQCAPETIRDWSPLPCNHSWYYSSKLDSGLHSKCESRVVLPVHKSKKRSIKEELIDGFQFRIEWNVSENCSVCDSNGGRCAYDNRSMEFCHNSKGKNVIFAVSSVGGVALVAAVILFSIFYMRTRKQLRTQGLGSDFSDYHRSDMEA
ncbi:hypothetical protein KI387_010723, partial [Taxus chinensis]